MFLISFIFSESDYYDNRIVSQIEIEGNKKTKDFILLREIHHPLNGPVDKALIERDRNRLENLGIFSLVSWELVPTKSGTFILRYKVHESLQSTPPTVFPIYNESKGWSLGALWLFNNFQGRNQLLALSGSIGGEDTYGVNFQDPWLLNDRISFSINIKKNLYENRFLNCEVEFNSKKIGLGKWISNEIKTGISCAFESKNFIAKKENVLYKYFDSYLNLKYDNRNIIWNPNKGILFSSSFGYLVGYDSKNFQTLIWDQSLSYFVKLNKLQNSVFALNGVLKKTLGYRSIFFQEYLGGSNSIRGWRIPDPKIYESEPFRFGHDYFHTSMEYRYELIPKFITPAGIESGLSIVLFTDAGFIAESGYSKHILYGFGFGIRIPFPILGVLRLDYGLGLFNYKVKSNALHFGIGHKF